MISRYQNCVFRQKLPLEKWFLWIFCMKIKKCKKICRAKKFRRRRDWTIDLTDVSRAHYQRRHRGTNFWSTRLKQTIPRRQARAQFGGSKNLKFARGLMVFLPPLRGGYCYFCPRCAGGHEKSLFYCIFNNKFWPAARAGGVITPPPNCALAIFLLWATSYNWYKWITHMIVCVVKIEKICVTITM